MLNDRDKGVVLKILAHADRIIVKTENIDKSVFLSNEDIRDIVCFHIFQIGELAKNLSEEFVKEFNGIPWKNIKGMRDRIGHGYDTLDLDIVFCTVKENIPEVINYCTSIINKES